MEKIRIIEKAKGMEKEGALKLLKYHQGLQRTKLDRLGAQVVDTNMVFDALEMEIERREKEGAI